MTLTLKLSDEQATALQAKAEAEGLSPSRSGLRSWPSQWHRIRRLNDRCKRRRTSFSTHARRAA